MGVIITGPRKRTQVTQPQGNTPLEKAVHSEKPASYRPAARALEPKDMDNATDADWAASDFVRKAGIERDQSWEQAQRQGISLGMQTYPEAVAKGYRHQSPHEDPESAREIRRDAKGWTQLPETLYHTTTDLPSVLQHGLKSRAELGSSGHGLGGGHNDPISMTEDPKIASDILSGLNLMHGALTGKVTDEHLMGMARQGHEGSQPFDQPLAKHIEKVNTSGRSEIEKRAEKARGFLMHRELAGGPSDPAFVGTDWDRLSKMDPSNFGIVRSSGAGHGYRMGGMGEWRTHHGGAVPVQGTVLSNQFGGA